MIKIWKVNSYGYYIILIEQFYFGPSPFLTKYIEHVINIRHPRLGVGLNNCIWKQDSPNNCLWLWASTLMDRSLSYGIYWLVVIVQLYFNPVFYLATTWDEYPFHLEYPILMAYKHTGTLFCPHVCCCLCCHGCMLYLVCSRNNGWHITRTKSIPYINFSNSLLVAQMNLSEYPR